MSTPKIKELLVYKKDLILKSASHSELDEREYLFQHTVFNEKGRVLNEKNFSPDGNLVSELQLTYNENDFLISHIMLEEDGTVAEHKTFEPDEKGNIAREYVHYLDGTFDTIIWNYNSQGQLIGKQASDSEGDLESTEEFDYANGHLVHYVMKDADGDILAEKEIERNEKGDETQVDEYDGIDRSSIRRVIEYYPSGSRKETLVFDDNDKLVEKVMLSENEKGQLVEVIEETPVKKNTIKFTYDEKSNIILQEEYNRQGEIISTISRVWDENSRLQESEVFIDGSGRGISRNYTIRHEYKYF